MIIKKHHIAIFNNQFFIKVTIGASSPLVNSAKKYHVTSKIILWKEYPVHSSNINIIPVIPVPKTIHIKNIHYI